VKVTFPGLAPPYRLFFPSGPGRCFLPPRFFRVFFPKWPFVGLVCSPFYTLSFPLPEVSFSPSSESLICVGMACFRADAVFPLSLDPACKNFSRIEDPKFLPLAPCTLPLLFCVNVFPLFPVPITVTFRTGPLVGLAP